MNSNWSTKGNVEHKLEKWLWRSKSKLILDLNEFVKQIHALQRLFQMIIITKPQIFRGRARYWFHRRGLLKRLLRQTSMNFSALVLEIARLLDLSCWTTMNMSWLEICRLVVSKFSDFSFPLGLIIKVKFGPSIVTKWIRALDNFCPHIMFLNLFI